MIKGIAITMAILSICNSLSAQMVVIKGYVSDFNTHEPIPAVTIIDLSSATGASSAENGTFKLLLNKGTHRLLFSHIGYTEVDTIITLRDSLSISVLLKSADVSLPEVKVSAEAPQDIVRSSGMSSLTMKQKDIMKMPSLLGETDPLGLLRYTPGVQSGSEGNVGFIVRGGSNDQNLILYDNALVYNPGHLLGFFSIFNPDLIRDVNLIKSGIPAKFGGKLSSVINIRSIQGNPDSVEVKGNIGLISSRLTVSGPVSEKTSFILAARRTYLDLFAKPVISSLVKNQTFFGKKNDYNFFDLNAGFLFNLSTSDKIFISAYTGKDRYELHQEGLNQDNNVGWGNSLITFQWDHNTGQNASVKTSASWTKYIFELSGSQEDYSLSLFSFVEDYNLRSDFSLISGNHNISAGLEVTEHKFIPTRIDAAATGFLLNFGQFSEMNAMEAGLFIDDEISFSPEFSVSAGLRYSLFSHHGPYTRYIKNDSDRILDTISYKNIESVAFYSNPEPRLIARYKIDNESSVKASYMRTAQYIHLSTSATVSLPTDVWIPSTDGIKPITGNQVSLGYFRTFADNEFEFSSEMYFKDMNNKPEFMRGVIYNSMFGDFKQNIVSGYARAYGAEIYLRKKKGNFTGWLSYSLARTEQKFDEINSGLWYPAKYDRRHDITLVVTEKLNNYWNLSATFVFITGNAYTVPVGRYVIQGNIINQYGAVNTFRMPPYHRADLSLSRKIMIKKTIPTELTFSVYNVYNRANPYFIYFEAKGSIEDYSLQIKPIQVSLFPVIPSLSWSFFF
ncbi:MAG TPA: TonB-dependent receptor [Bacteroidales bacterium]|nr:TonB-dependent receptor [Bacteroidales bacterium]